MTGGGWSVGERERGTSNVSSISSPFKRSPITSVHLNNPNTTGDFPRCTVEPHNTGDVYLLVQCDTSGGINKLECGVHIVRFPCHLLVLGTGSGSTHRKGELGAVVGEREGDGFWPRDDAGDLRRVGDLDSEDLTF